MQHIKQKHKYGCGIACIAMASNSSYEDIINILKINPKKETTNVIKIYETLISLNINAKPLVITNDFTLYKKAVVFIKYDNGAFHAVMWNGKNILDPENNKYDNDYYINKCIALIPID
jgi:ABC-type bacteriocin/lantibiotic exporter with double-glycine peptidase domain